MTKCLTPQEIETFHDGELSSAAQRAMAAHLSACETCRRELDDLQRIDRQLCEAYSAITIRESWLARMQEMIHAASQTASPEPAPSLSSERRRSSPNRRYLLAFAAAAGILLLLTSVARQTSYLRSLAVQSPPVAETKDAEIKDQLASRVPTVSANSSRNDIPADSSVASAVKIPDKPVELREHPVAPTVRGQGDFLVARHPDADDEFEFYLVLPIRK